MGIARILILLVGFLGLGAQAGNLCPNDLIQQANQRLTRADFPRFQITRSGWAEKRIFKVWGTTVPGGVERELGQITVLPSQRPGQIGIDIHIDEVAREQGLQHVLYAKALEKFSDTTSIYHTLDGTNVDAYYRALMVHLAIEHGTTMPPKTFLMGAQGQFMQCCSRKFSRLSREERMRLIHMAAADTPAHKSSSRYGFSKICRLEVFASGIEPVFSSCLD